jgi:hypothetical protein
VDDCGWVTCSLYLSRSQTRWLNDNIALAGGGFILNAMTHAAGDNGCFRIRYPALAFDDDLSSFCHNT